MKTPTLRARCLTGIILSLRLVSYYRIITRFPDISPEIGWKNGPFNYTFISEKCTPGKMYTRKIYQALKCTPENCTSGNMYTRKIVHLEQPWKLYTEKCTLGKMYARKNVHSKFGCTNFRVYIFPDVQFSGVHFSGVQISVYKFNSFYHVMCSSQVFSWISFAYLTHDANGRGSKAIGVDFLVWWAWPYTSS